MTKWLVLLFVCVSAPAWAQNPCTVAQTGLAVVANPNASIHATFANFDATFNGLPRWTESEVGVFVQGSNPATTMPFRNLIILKASWTLVLGTTNCYRAAGAGAFLFGVTPNVEYDLYVRLRNPAATDPAARIGAWSAPASPFGRLGPPDALMAVRITP